MPFDDYIFSRNNLITSNDLYSNWDRIDIAIQTFDIQTRFPPTFTDTDEKKILAIQEMKNLKVYIDNLLRQEKDSLLQPNCKTLYFNNELIVQQPPTSETQNIQHMTITGPTPTKTSTDTSTDIPPLTSSGK